MPGTERPSWSQRASAVTAIGTLLAAAALTAVRVAARFGVVLLAIAGLLICVTACWHAVSRRGVARLVSALIAALALAALVTGFVLSVITYWVIPIIAGLGVVSVLAARHALRGARQRPIAAAGRAAAVRPVLIMNLKSGGGKAERFDLVGHCRRRGIEPVILHPGDDLIGLAEDAIGRGADAIGMAGGDGSQAAVASVAARHGIPHVCVPAGTRNHFALDLGLDRDDVVGALDAFSDPVEHRIDLATVNGRTFVNNCSLGLYAQVVQSAEYRDAKLRTAADALPDLLGPDAEPLDLRFAGPGGERFDTAQLILVSNNPYELMHAGGAGSRKRLDSGQLGIAAVQVSDAADARRFMTLELAGQIQRFGGWRQWEASRFEVNSGAPVRLGVDGEALEVPPPLVFQSCPGALRVWLPSSASRRSPAAQAVQLLARSTLVDLARVAAGTLPHD